MIGRPFSLNSELTSTSFVLCFQRVGGRGRLDRGDERAAERGQRADLRHEQLLRHRPRRRRLPRVPQQARGQAGKVQLQATQQGRLLQGEQDLVIQPVTSFS